MRNEAGIVVRRPDAHRHRARAPPATACSARSSTPSSPCARACSTRMIEADCSNASYITIADIVLGSVTGRRVAQHRARWRHRHLGRARRIVVPRRAPEPPRRHARRRRSTGGSLGDDRLVRRVRRRDRPAPHAATQPTTVDTTPASSERRRGGPSRHDAHLRIAEAAPSSGSASVASPCSPHSPRATVARCDGPNDPSPWR